MNDDRNEHTANSTNGHDPRAADDLFGTPPMDDDSEQAARQRARKALAETVHRYRSLASLAYGSIHAALRDVDAALSLCDTGYPPPVEGDVSAYERAQLHRWEKEADAAERGAPPQLKRVARDLRQIAERIDNALDPS